MDNASDSTYIGQVTPPATPAVSAEGSDPREFFRVLWRRKWVVVACLVLIPLATYIVSTRLSKTYDASSIVQLQSAAANQSLPVTGDLTGSGNDQQSNDRVAALIET